LSITAKQHALHVVPITDVLVVHILRVPTLLVTKNSRTFPGPRSIFPGPCRKPAMFQYTDKHQQHPYWSICSSLNMLRRNSKETVRTQNRGVRTRIFWRLRPQHSVRIVAQQIPGLSMSWKFYKHNSGPFQEAWEPRYCTAVAYAATGGSHALTGTCPLNHRLGMSTNSGEFFAPRRAQIPLR